jgi:glycosyltransferase involved in cell wall biosynthesis
MSIDISNPIKLIKDFGVVITNPKLSVIIITWNRENELIECLKGLEHQVEKQFEIIIVDNGNSNLSNYEGRNFKYVQLIRNFRPSFARNVCLQFARAKTVAFLDDDAVPERRWVEKILASFKNNKIIALRGKIISKSTENIYNLMANHYDLGKVIIPSFIDLEGNCAFDKDKLLKVHGFNPQIFGFEGLELTHRLIGNRNIHLSIYDPSVVIYHNYCDSFFHFLSKIIKHAKNSEILKRQNHGFSEFKQKYLSLRTKKEDIDLNLLLRLKLLFLRSICVLASGLGAFIVFIKKLNQFNY